MPVTKAYIAIIFVLLLSTQKEGGKEFHCFLINQHLLVFPLSVCPHNLSCLMVFVYSRETLPAGVETSACGYQSSVTEDLESSTEAMVEFLPFFLRNADFLLKLKKIFSKHLQSSTFVLGKGHIQ